MDFFEAYEKFGKDVGTVRLRLVGESGSYDEYVVRCAAAGCAPYSRKDYSGALDFLHPKLPEQKRVYPTLIPVDEIEMRPMSPPVGYKETFGR